VSFVKQLPDLVERRCSLTRHPELHLVNAVCATCGTGFTVRTTAQSLSVELCSNCHPAYTGAQRITAR
jgi:large subunit ribosomal protein L31